VNRATFGACEPVVTSSVVAAATQQWNAPLATVQEKWGPQDAHRFVVIEEPVVLNRAEVLQTHDPKA